MLPQLEQTLGFLAETFTPVSIKLRRSLYGVYQAQIVQQLLWNVCKCYVSNWQDLVSCQPYYKDASLFDHNYALSTIYRAVYDDLHTYYAIIVRSAVDLSELPPPAEPVRLENASRHVFAMTRYYASQPQHESE
jgi:hypothetical protein